MYVDRFGVKEFGWYENQDFWKAPIIFSNHPNPKYLHMNLSAVLMVAIL